jgi:LuxR family transcriptional regulator, maltose regulon positive regulatory protein
MSRITSRSTLPTAEPESQLQLQLPTRLKTIGLFESRLHPPRLRCGTVIRKHLEARVDDGDFVIVEAPAGYGKTTLLAQWAAGQPRVAWLTVGTEDNDPLVFAAHLVCLFDRLSPLRTDELAAFLEANTADASILLPSLGRLVSSRPAPFSILVDDVHLLRRPQAQHVLEVVAAHLPEEGRLVIAGRPMPVVKEGLLRTVDEVVEINLDDLVLSHDESLDLLRGAGLVLDSELERSLVKEAEGWAAGLYILGKAAGRTRCETSSGALAIEPYLRREVLVALDEHTLEFLTRTSVLEHLDGLTCDALLDQTGSGLTLAELARRNSFVVRLDSPIEQFRYHALLRDLLRTELSRREPAFERVLHERACVIFESRGETGLAIQHAILANDVERAAGLVWCHGADMIAMGRLASVTEWLRAFSSDAFESFPALPVIMAWSCMSATETRDIFPWIEIARRHDPATRLPGGTPLGSAVALLEALACQRGVTAMIRAAEEAIALDDPPSIDGPFVAMAHLLAGAGLAALGRSDAARDRLEHAARIGTPHPAARALALAQLAYLAVADDDWLEAAALVARGRALCDRYFLWSRPYQMALHAVSALVAHHAHDDTRAGREVDRGRRLLSRANYLAPWMPLQTCVVFAGLEFELGDIDQARQLAREARCHLDRVPDALAPAAALEGLAEGLGAVGREPLSMAAPLTSAELRVLLYLPTHLSYPEIAKNLFVSLNTVKSQATTVYRKLGVTARSDAVRRGRELGLLDP